MKQIFLILLFLTCSISSIAQEASVEKSVFGIQTGFWGIWGYHEARLGTKWAFRTELGAYDYFGLANGIHLEPVLNLEPRWYFNLNKRSNKGKRIDNNKGLFVALRTSIRPDFFDLPADPWDEQVNPSVALVPYFGARKPLGEKLNYELGFGLGAEYFSKGYSGFFEESRSDEFDPKFGVAFNIHLRIGLDL